MKPYALFILVIGCLLTISDAWSFTLNNSTGASFKEDEVFINVASPSCDNIGLSQQELLDMTQEAVDKFWNQVPTSRLELKAGQIVPTSTLYKTDLVCVSNSNPCTPTETMKGSQIIIACNNNAVNYSDASSVFAITVTNNIAGQEIVGAVILLNDTVNNPFKTHSREEQISVLAHEIGHAVGLGHSELEESLMYFQSFAGRQTLAWDDFYGITYLYPSEQPMACFSTANVNSSGSNGQLILSTLFLFALGLGLAKLFAKLWQPKHA